MRLKNYEAAAEGFDWRCAGRRTSGAATATVSAWGWSAAVASQSRCCGAYGPALTEGSSGQEIRTLRWRGWGWSRGLSLPTGRAVRPQGTAQPLGGRQRGHRLPDAPVVVLEYWSVTQPRHRKQPTLALRTDQADIEALPPYRIRTESLANRRESR
jgi:hypothetical protein